MGETRAATLSKFMGTGAERQSDAPVPEKYYPPRTAGI